MNPFCNLGRLRITSSSRALTELLHAAFEPTACSKSHIDQLLEQNVNPYLDGLNIAEVLIPSWSRTHLKSATNDFIEYGTWLCLDALKRKQGDIYVVQCTLEHLIVHMIEHPDSFFVWKFAVHDTFLLLLLVKLAEGDTSLKINAVDPENGWSLAHYFFEYYTDTNNSDDVVYQLIDAGLDLSLRDHHGRPAIQGLDIRKV